MACLFRFFVYSSVVLNIAMPGARRSDVVCWAEAFAAVAALIAAIGIFAVTRQIAAERSTEIAVRISIDGQPWSVARQILWKLTAWSAAGLVAGHYAARFATSQLALPLSSGRAALGEWWWVPGLLIVLVIAAAAWPAVLRMVKTDPVNVLRRTT